MSPMNPRLLVPTQPPGILDFAPGAAAAYSLRNLSRSYAGPVVTVRRSTDSAEADFTAAEVSDGTLAGWAGADGFVKQWWDQSGNARHATQATAASQPQIVDSGVLVTEGGKAAILFDGVDDTLTVPSSTAAFKFLHDGTKSAVAIVASPGFTADPDDAFGLFGNTAGASANVGVRIAYNDRASESANNAINVVIRRDVSGTSAVLHVVNDVFLPIQSNMVFIIFDAANATAEKRVLTAANGGVLVGTNTFTLSPSASNATYDAQIGSMGNNVLTFAGRFSELLIYPTDQTALRTRIEGNLAWYY